MDMTAVAVSIVGDWAWLTAQPHEHGTRAQPNSYDPVSALMHRTDSAWTLAEIACFEVDSIECMGSPEFVTRFAARHPGVPQELLPRGGIAASVLDAMIGGERVTRGFAELSQLTALAPGVEADDVREKYWRDIRGLPETRFRSGGAKRV